MEVTALSAVRWPSGSKEDPQADPHPSPPSTPPSCLRAVQVGVVGVRGWPASTNWSVVLPPGQQQQPTERRLELVAFVRKRLSNQAFDFSMTAEAPDSGSPTVQPDQLTSGPCPGVPGKGDLHACVFIDF